VIACCETGMRSGAAARVLQAQGFTKVVNLKGACRRGAPRTCRS